MRVAVYARVSTREQTPDNQLEDLRRYCQGRSWEITKEFIDQGISGAKDDRPALRELMDAVRKRRADAVLVWRFDRFARSLKHLINTLTEFNDMGIHFVSYSESLDTSTSQGRLVFSILGAIGEFERDLITERVNSGIRRAKAAGIRFGRPRNEWTEADQAKARQLRAEGRSIREIGAELHVPPTKVYRLFQNPSNELMNSSVGTGSHK